MKNEKNPPVTLDKYWKFLNQIVKWPHLNFGKSNLSRVAHFNTCSLDLVLLPDMPGSCLPPGQPWPSAVNHHTPAKALSSPRSLPITPPPRLCSTFALQAVFFQTEFNFSVQSYCCLFMFYLGTMGRSCQTHVLNRKVLGGRAVHGGPSPSPSASASNTELAPSRKASGEAGRWQSRSGNHDHQAASQGGMKESWLPF